MQKVVAYELVDLQPNVFHHFPGGDQMELRGLTVERYPKWFGDVTREQVRVRQPLPVRPPVLERKIRTLQSHALPAERDEVGHRLPVSTTEIYHPQRGQTRRAASHPFEG